MELNTIVEIYELLDEENQNKMLSDVAKTMANNYTLEEIQHLLIKFEKAFKLAKFIYENAKMALEVKKNGNKQF